MDDASKIPVTLEAKGCILVRNEVRAGVAASRHIGAIHASKDCLLIIDCHNRFQPGWYEAAVARVKDRPTTAHCCTCLQLAPYNMDVTKPSGAYHGATINFYGPDRNAAGKMQFMEGVWIAEQAGDDYPIACMMGASYLLPTEFFFHVGGLRLLRSWGSDEPYLSLKWWLAGGEIRMFKGVQIGHQFRAASPYKTDSSHLWYNKIAIVRTCLPDAEASRLLKKFPTHLPEVNKARQQTIQDANLILSEKHYQESIRVRDFSWFLAQFGLSFPT